MFYANKGSLEYWLTERYCFYTENNGRLFRGEIHHNPWPLQKAEADINENTMIHIDGFNRNQTPLLLHYANKLDVLLWGLEKV